jgi:hypothetical protein
LPHCSLRLNFHSFYNSQEYYRKLVVKPIAKVKKAGFGGYENQGPGGVKLTN